MPSCAASCPSVKPESKDARAKSSDSSLGIEILIITAK